MRPLHESPATLVCGRPTVISTALSGPAEIEHHDVSGRGKLSRSGLEEIQGVWRWLDCGQNGRAGGKYSRRRCTSLSRHLTAPQEYRRSAHPNSSLLSTKTTHPCSSLQGPGSQFSSRESFFFKPHEGRARSEKEPVSELELEKSRNRAF